MKTKNQILKSSVLILPALLVMLNPGLARLFAEETKFTYQGRLNDATAPANGIYDFTFTIYDLPTGNGAFAVETNLATGVTNGLFTTTLDFGSFVSESIFSGPQRWLEIAVRTNGVGQYIPLTPRQRLTATPYAITAANVISNGLSAGTYSNPITFNNAGNIFAGNGGGLNNVNAATLGGFTAANFWNLSGNTVSAADFLGTLNNVPLELKVNNNHALRIAPATVPSLEGGYVQNTTHGFSSAAIVGGGLNGGINEVTGNYGFIGTGYALKAGLNSAVIDGAFNVATGGYSFVGGGQNNTNLADLSVIGGGYNNHVTLGANNGFVGAGFNNTAGSGNTVVAGGANNIADVNAAAVAGGSENHAAGDHAFIGGGQGNAESAAYATIGGGAGNIVNATAGTIAGGWPNTIQIGANFSAIGGGQNNLIQTNAQFSSVGGGHANTIHPGATESTIAGGLANSAGGVATNTSISGATVAGGVSNRADSAYSFVGGGKNNIVSDQYLFATFPASPYAVISGGEANWISTDGYIAADHCAIGGGLANQIHGGTQSAISGGGNNQITGSWSTIAGGQYNLVSGNYSFVAGQDARTFNNGTFVWADSTPGTFSSTGDNQFCIKAQGGIQLAAGTSMFFGTSTRQMLNLFGIQYGIGVQSGDQYFRSASDFCWFRGGVHNNNLHDAGGGTELMRLDNAGNLTISGSFGPLSDRNAKEHFDSINPREVLAKVSALPISTWNYKTDPASRHLGPMAQDFYAAFGLGADNKHITTVDADGVTFAAIQGLNEKMESENALLREQLSRQQTQNAELKQRLERLEKLVLGQGRTEARL